MIDHFGLGIVGHPATINNELVLNRVFPWNEDRGFKTIGFAGEANRGRPLYAEMWCRRKDEGGKTKRKPSGYRRHKRNRITKERRKKKQEQDKQTCLVKSSGDYNFTGVRAWPVFK
jgi:hypothetical protein